MDKHPIPELRKPEIRGDIAEAQGLVWAEHEPAPDADHDNRLLVPELWVDDAVRGALAQYYDDIVDAVKADLKERTENLRGS